MDCRGRGSGVHVITSSPHAANKVEHAMRSCSFIYVQRKSTRRGRRGMSAQHVALHTKRMRETAACGGAAALGMPTMSYETVTRERAGKGRADVHGRRTVGNLTNAAAKRKCNSS